MERIAGWADDQTMANLALYDCWGALRLGRSGMEIWERPTDGSEASPALPPALRHG